MCVSRESVDGCVLTFVTAGRYLATLLAVVRDAAGGRRHGGGWPPGGCGDDDDLSYVPLRLLEGMVEGGMDSDGKSTNAIVTLLS